MRFFLLLFSVLVFNSFHAQQNELSATLRIKSESYKNNKELLNLLVEANIDMLFQAQAKIYFSIHYVEENIASISCTYETLNKLLSDKIISYAELPSSHNKIMNDTMIYRNRIKPIKLWTSPLPQAYNGEGIIIGIIDTGIDFSHPDFKDSLGNTRIKFIWDQTVNTNSVHPLPFNYGKEWTSSQINASLCTHSDLAYYGHGTHVSGIAAGNALANGTHEGVASKAEIIVVALDFNKSGPTISDAVKFIFDKAQALGKPCVINASVGDYYGSHDATDLESKLIESQLKNKPGRVMVAAAGNAGSDKFHVKTEIKNTDTLFTWLKNPYSQMEYWNYADTSQIRNLKLRVGVNRNNFIDIGVTKFYNYRNLLSGIKRDTIYKNSKRIGIIEQAASINNKGVCEWYINILPDTLNYLWRVESTGIGTHHAWNFDFASSGLPSIQQYSKMKNYVMPDTFYTMVSGFQNSEEVITVGNYVNLSKYKDVNNQIQSLGFTGGKISYSSSNGPTRDGRIKPDITATGESVFSAITLGWRSYYLANKPNEVAYGGMHVLGGGTSAAAPVVAGLAALYLQRYPNATSIEVKNAIRNCAYQDAFTGNNLPNYQWGFGKLDGKATMTCNDVKIFTSLGKNKNKDVIIFPNPFNEKIKFEFQSVEERKVIFFNSIGEKLLVKDFNSNLIVIEDESILKNYKGFIFGTIETNDGTTNFKLIKN